MKQQEQEDLARILLLSRDILDMLRDKGELGLISRKMQVRNVSIMQLFEGAALESREEMLRQLMVVRDEEDKLLESYRVEYREVESALIGLGHSRQYSTIDE